MEHLPLKQIDKTDGAHGQPSLYESDFYQWIQQTAGALKAKAFDQVDWDNVIEEIESMGRSERRELKSRLIVLLEHLLKLHYWSAEGANNERGWRNTIIEQRRQIQLVLDDSPSLRAMLTDIYPDAYRQAREDVLLKSQLPENAVPSAPPYEVAEALSSQSLLA
ncbi:DUF29 domain-containing protein [Nodosilinea sp. LEGE 07298]|uniref:DUF29 domain-containing protein n=1 Tax=Nodosilinea sp. LEGE 07298 TaxID=2777970 RepID=UPI00187FE3E7|nr:DUF29 domain-containing protein [Nodosilinea sp. LEGE 07298]MBE9113712.1 DUF29 domain-containing protein [Nodosilinea sp. LEGE 07298]